LVSPALPFSFEQVHSYFDDAFGRSAYRVRDGTFVYIEGNARDESVTIALPTTQGRIAVTLFARGDRGLNYLREFFEAPFFGGQRANSCTPSLMQINPGRQNSVGSM
jgi:hypothetical protein